MIYLINVFAINVNWNRKIEKLSAFNVSMNNRFELIFLEIEGSSAIYFFSRKIYSTIINRKTRVLQYLNI